MIFRTFPRLHRPGQAKLVEEHCPAGLILSRNGNAEQVHLGERTARPLAPAEPEKPIIDGHEHRGGAELHFEAVPAGLPPHPGAFVARQSGLDSVSIAFVNHGDAE